MRSKRREERKSECEDIMEAVELEMRTSEPTGGIEGHHCHLFLSVIVWVWKWLAVFGSLAAEAATAAAAGVKTDSCQWHLFNDLYTG